MVKKGIFKPQHIFIFSQTYKTDPSQKILIDYCAKKYKKFRETNCFEDIDEVLLLKMFEV